MLKIKKGVLLLALFFGSIHVLEAQISGNNLLEYQYGKLPSDNSKFSSFYDRAVVGYTYNAFKAGITLEQFYTPFQERNYTQLTQYSFQYNSKIVTVKLGNFQETIGRGLLLRSFEIPGAILEDLSYRSRNYFQRDIQGFSTHLKFKDFTTKIIYGKPLNNVFPPTQSNSLRRSDEIKAIYSDYSFKKQTIGLSVLDVSNSSGNKQYGMATVSGKVSPIISYYTEFAKEVGDANFSDFSKISSHAYYGNINFTFEKLGISAEYKDYNDFNIGAGINEPPALIKEHSYKVLNRSTHVVQPLNETGYQIEMYYTFPDASTLTFNNAIARNKLGNEFVFKEYFTEYSFAIAQKHDVKVFLDYAEDPFKLEENRISAGTYFEWKAFKKATLKTEYEFQTFSRTGENIQNHVLTLGYAYKSKLVFNIVTELSNDSFITQKKLKSWIGANIKYQLNKSNSLQLFGGQRRGGPACNAGICYEVLDFNGAELRWTARF